MGLDSEHCLCSMHVHTAARLISIKSMMLAVFKFCFLLFQLLYLDNTDKREHGLFLQSYNRLIKPYEQDFVTTIELVVCVILAGVSMLLFYGNRQGKTVFYYPFILYSTFEALQALGNIGYFIFATYHVKHDEDPTLANVRDQMFIYCIVITIIFIILYSLRTYIFLIVVTQALMFLLRAQKLPNSSTLTVPTNMSNAGDNKMLSDYSNRV